MVLNKNKALQDNKGTNNQTNDVCSVKSPAPDITSIINNNSTETAQGSELNSSCNILLQNGILEAFKALNDNNDNIYHIQMNNSNDEQLTNSISSEHLKNSITKNIEKLDSQKQASAELMDSDNLDLTMQPTLQVGDSSVILNLESESYHIAGHVEDTEINNHKFVITNLEEISDPSYIPDFEEVESASEEDSEDNELCMNNLLNEEDKTLEDVTNNSQSLVSLHNSEKVNILSSISDSENDGNRDEIQVTKSRPKRGRKPKYEGQTQKNVKNKKKNSNAPYYNYRGVHKKPKQFINFICKCSNQCHTAISSESRQEEFKKFWELSNYNTQNMFIGACVKESKKSSSYTGNTSNKTYSRTYALKGIKVCRDMFVNTYGVSTKRVNTALCKLRSENNALVDLRGQKQGGQNKLSDSTFERIRFHINSIPRYKSHYRRNDTESEFLPPEMTIQKMYSLYVSDLKESNEKPASFSSYRRVFMTNFNLRFKNLKKDTCNVCDGFAAKIENAKGEDEKTIMEREHAVHCDLWAEAREEMNADLNLAKERDDFECCTFDLEKTLPLPRIPTNIIFYKKQLWIYNASVHSGKTNRGFCYVWAEGQAGRGAREIGSCLLKYILNEVGNNVTTLALWSDSCGGQNRNIKMVLLLKAILECHPSLQEIYLRFLVSGHSFLPNDTDFSDIESALKHAQRLYLPEDYMMLMKTCRKKKAFRSNQNGF